MIAPMPFDARQEPQSQQALLVPARWRYRPLTAAIWRMLIVDVAKLRSVVSDPRTRGLDAAAARLVLTAIGGNVPALKMIADLIDGPVRRCVESSTNPSDDDSQTVERVIIEIEKALAGLPTTSHAAAS